MYKNGLDINKSQWLMIHKTKSNLLFVVKQMIVIK